MKFDLIDKDALHNKQRSNTKWLHIATNFFFAQLIINNSSYSILWKCQFYYCSFTVRKIMSWIQCRMFSYPIWHDERIATKSKWLLDLQVNMFFLLIFSCIHHSDTHHKWKSPIRQGIKIMNLLIKMKLAIKFTNHTTKSIFRRNHNSFW